MYDNLLWFSLQKFDIWSKYVYGYMIITMLCTDYYDDSSFYIYYV